MSKQTVVIIGAGLAGLTCAFYLKQADIPFLLLEADSRVGGRVKTDLVNGFRLDRGFQVFLSAYQEAGNLWHENQLDLKHFAPGSLIFQNGRLLELSDPFRQPSKFFQTLLSPVATFKDKIHILQLRDRLVHQSLDSIMRSPERSTQAYLNTLGFSEQFQTSFLRPFFGGVFLDNALETSSRVFEFVFKMFSEGYASLPNHGIETLATSLLERLPQSSVLTNHRVEQITANTVYCANGFQIEAEFIVIACDPCHANSLVPDLRVPDMVGTTCLYYEAPFSPIPKPMLVLNGEAVGNVLHCCCPSDIAPGYAPSGQALISVTLRCPVSELDNEQVVREELANWFGAETSEWQLIKSIHVPQALPAFYPAQYPVKKRDPQISPTWYVCGDYQESPSIEGAVLSGRKVAQHIFDRAIVLRT